MFSSIQLLCELINFKFRLIQLLFHLLRLQMFSYDCRERRTNAFLADNNRPAVKTYNFLDFCFLKLHVSLSFSSLFLLFRTHTIHARIYCYSQQILIPNKKHCDDDYHEHIILSSFTFRCSSHITSIISSSNKFQELWKENLMKTLGEEKKNRQVVARAMLTVSLFWNFSFRRDLLSTVCGSFFVFRLFLPHFLSCFGFFIPLEVIFFFIFRFVVASNPDDRTSLILFFSFLSSLEVIQWFNEIHVLLFSWIDEKIIFIFWDLLVFFSRCGEVFNLRSRLFFLLFNFIESQNEFN